MRNADFYEAYLKARRVTECLLISHVKEDPAVTDYYRNDAIDEMRKLAWILGFELVQKPEAQKEAA